MPLAVTGGLAAISQARSSSERARCPIALAADPDAMVVVPANEAMMMPAMIAVAPIAAMVPIAPIAVAVTVTVMVPIAPVTVAVMVAIVAIRVGVAVAMLVRVHRLVLSARRRQAERSGHEQRRQKNLCAYPHLASPHVVAAALLQSAARA